jgi:hypothetical protein
MQANDTNYSVIDIISQLTLDNGIVPLTAEKLHLPAQQIINALATDPTAIDLLAKYFRVKVMLDSFRDLQVVSSIVMQGMAESEYADDIKHLSVQSQIFLELTRAPANAPTTNINVFDKVMAMLPKEVRDAVAVAAGPSLLQDNGNAPKRPGRPRKQLMSAEGDDLD